MIRRCGLCGGAAATTFAIPWSPWSSGAFAPLRRQRATRCNVRKTEAQRAPLNASSSDIGPNGDVVRQNEMRT